MGASIIAALQAIGMPMTPWPAKRIQALAGPAFDTASFENDATLES
jgi:hypothetical protein